MRVYGETFIFINWWMDFLCLLLAARLSRCRFSTVKAMVSAGFGALYGMAAWAAGKPVLRCVPILLLVCLGMAFIAFGRRGPRLFPTVTAAGWLLSGLSDFVLKHGASPASVIWIDGGAALCVLLVKNRICIPYGGRCFLRIEYEGRTALLPALRDTGNLLTDHASGLPVIVVSQTLARIFLPAGTQINDLSTLPPGWRLIRVKTAAGGRTLMCFYPDRTIIRHGKHAWPTEAMIAVSDFEESRALLPDSLFSEQREGRSHAVL